MDDLVLTEPARPIDAAPGDLLIVAEEGGDQYVRILAVFWDMLKVRIAVDDEIVTTWITTTELNDAFGPSWYIEAIN